MISEVRPACQVDPAWQVDLRVEAALRALVGKQAGPA